VRSLHILHGSLVFSTPKPAPYSSLRVREQACRVYNRQGPRTRGLQFDPCVQHWGFPANFVVAFRCSELTADCHHLSVWPRLSQNLTTKVAVDLIKLPSSSVPLHVTHIGEIQTCFASYLYCFGAFVIWWRNHKPTYLDVQLEL
jgi:hypothetical protein